MKTGSILHSVAAVVLMGALTMPVLAQGSIQDRLREQDRRINEGVRSGQLTRTEAARLRAREVNIRWDNKIAHITGGRFTRAERARLEAKLNRTSNAIYDDKHNRPRR